MESTTRLTQTEKEDIAFGASLITGQKVEAKDIGAGGYAPNVLPVRGSDGKILYNPDGTPQTKPHLLTLSNVTVEVYETKSAEPQPKEDWGRKFYRVRHNGMIFKVRKSDVKITGETATLNGEFRVFVVKATATAPATFALAPEGQGCAKADFWV